MKIIIIVVIILIVIYMLGTNNSTSTSLPMVEWIGPELVSEGEKGWKAEVEGETIYAISPTRNRFVIGSLKTDQNNIIHVLNGNDIEIGRVEGDKIVFDNFQIFKFAQKVLNTYKTPSFETVAEICGQYLISTVGSKQPIAKVRGDARYAGAAMIALLKEVDNRTPYHVFWSSNIYDMSQQWDVRKNEL